MLKMGRAVNRHAGWLVKTLTRLASALRWLGHKLRFLRMLKYINPFRFIKRIDWYIIKKFVGYYFFSIALIISIAIVFDFNENLAKFSENHAPAKAIIFDYYANFVPSVPFSCLWQSFCSHQNWQATLKSSPCWHRACRSSDSCAHTSSPACFYRH